MKEKPIMIKTNEQILKIDHFIKLLLSETKFVIESKTSFIDLNFMFEIFVKKITDTVTIQTYIKIFKDITSNRIYNRKKWKIMTDFLCFFKISNKKHRTTQSKPPQYLLINAFDRVIKKKYIWFKKNMIEKSQRDATTLKAANKHCELKKNNWNVWIRDCDNYWMKKMSWKYHTVVRTYETEKITFFTKIFLEDLLDLMSSINNFYSFNFHDILSTW